MNHFLNEILSLPHDSPYALVPGGLGVLIGDGGILDNTAATALTTWCLLGEASGDADSANPLVRWAYVVDYLKRYGFPDADVPAQEILKRLDREYVKFSYVDSLVQSVALNAAASSQLRLLAGGREFEVDAADGFAQYQRLHKWVVTKFLEDPNSYADPVAYVDARMDTWPEPPTRYVFHRPFFRVKQADLKNYGDPEMFPARSVDDEVALHSFGQQPIKKTVDVVTATNWNYALGAAHLMFGDWSRDSPELNFHREKWVRETGVRCLEVI